MNDFASPLVPAMLDAVPPDLRGGVVAIGNFDGVHRGHAALLTAAAERAHALDAPAVALTFEPHPRTFFNPAEPVFRLSPVAAKARLFRALGLDGQVIATFDEAFSHLSAETFVSDVLVERLAIRGTVVGFDFQYGRKRGGDAQTLRAAGDRFGFAVDVVGAVSEGGGPVASRAIRQALRAGEIEAANALLGYRWFVVGEVRKGARRGRDLGYPTANLALADDCELRHGVYAVTVRTPDGVERGGVASFGSRPTFDDGPPLLEVFILDYEGDLYGRTLSVSFLAWIRKELRFETVADLVTAMDRDTATAQQILASPPPRSDLDRALAAID